MHEYNFRALSAYDLEILVGDLLSAELNVRLESFKSGRDAGIDLRYSKAFAENSLIVQTKHYVGSKFSDLYHKIKNEEVEKIKKICPLDYYLVTTLSTSPQENEKLEMLLKPVVRGTVKIYNVHAINSLLRAHPNIEKAHYKLWLTSTATMEMIFSYEIFSRNKRSIDEIYEKFSRYVQSQAFNIALRMLEDKRICIIAGIPGIGKTTLAETLLIHYVDNGFQPCIINSNIGEADKLSSEDKKIVYYYDDFLGQTSLNDKLAKNEDKDLLNFLSSVARNPNKRIILTTREYILNQAKEIYEPLYREDFQPLSMILGLQHYHRYDRARILLNHLTFSRIPRSFVQALCNSSELLRIIDHHNFNPRIIETMSQERRIISLNPVDFPSAILSSLDNPDQVWSHPFERQICSLSRVVLQSLFALSGEAIIKDVEDLCRALLQEKDKSLIFDKEKFKQSLRELDGSFVRTFLKEGHRRVQFSNPSVRDFLKVKIQDDLDWMHDLINCATDVSQLKSLIALIKDGYRSDRSSNLPDLVLERGTRIVQSSKLPWVFLETDFRLLLSIGRFCDSRLVYDIVVVLVEKLKMSLSRSWIDVRYAVNLHLLFTSWQRPEELELWNERFRGLELESFDLLVKKRILESLSVAGSFDEFEVFESFYRRAPELFSEDELQIAGLDYKRYCELFLDDFDESEDVDGYQERATDVDKIGEILSFDVSFYSDWLREKANELEAELKNRPDFDFDDDDRRIGSNFADADVREMFRSTFE